MRVAARAVERRLNADTSDHVEPIAAVRVRGPARYAGRHAKTFESVLGPLTLERAYYHCELCEAGFCPRDPRLGCRASSLSPGVLRMVGRVGAMVSFEEGHELLHELAGVEVPTKQVERAAEALGREIAEDEQRVVEPPAADEPLAPTLYLGMDGTGVPVRKAELVDRAGKQPDGSAKTREVKLVTVWSAEGRDKEGTPVRDEGSISYSAAIESAAQQGHRRGRRASSRRASMREATRRGFDRAARRAVLGDGAQWIWNLADEHFPDAIQIVDRFHAKQHLSDVAKAIYGRRAATWPSSGRKRAPRRAGRRRHRRRPRRPTRAFAEGSTRPASASTTSRRNRERMRYAEFRAAGLCTSTGVVEAGCKIAIGTRCKRAGHALDRRRSRGAIRAGDDGAGDDATTVYFTAANTGKVSKVPLGGGSPVLLSTGGTPQGIAVDASRIYWADGAANTVRVMPVGGGAVSDLVTGADAGWVAVDEKRVYFMGSALRAVPIGGGAVETIAAGPYVPIAFTKDATSVYTGHSDSSGTIVKIPLDGSAPVTLVQLTDNKAYDVAVDETCVYYVGAKDGALAKVAK